MFVRLYDNILSNTKKTLEKKIKVTELISKLKDDNLISILKGYEKPGEIILWDLGKKITELKDYENSGEINIWDLGRNPTKQIKDKISVGKNLAISFKQKIYIGQIIGRIFDINGEICDAVGITRLPLGYPPPAWQNVILLRGKFIPQNEEISNFIKEPRFRVDKDLIRLEDDDEKQFCELIGISPPSIELVTIRPPPNKSEKELTTDEQTMVGDIYNFIQNKGFTFPLHQIINYYLSFKTKPFIILTGISGTGKTKITELFAKAVCKDFKNQYLLLPVRPDWNDDRNLIGYYNPLTKQYQIPPFLAFIMKAEKDPENPYFVCLDEMNLARVEYYFSTFLSAMESGSKEFELPGFNGDMEYKTSIPSNLFFTGTVNMDETTYRFSPKVLDRANTIEFHEIDLLKSREKPDASLANPELSDPFKEHFLKDKVRNNTSSEQYQKWETENWDELVGFLHRINKEALEKPNLHFGYRIRDEILRYMYFAETLSSNGFTTEKALDFQIKQKILPRIKGPESISEALKSLREIIHDKLKSMETHHSTAKLDQMIEALDKNGYTDFYQ